ncbi:MAG: dockerin type I domain-containing protein [Candidatus Zixiibacteriota bacterium]
MNGKLLFASAIIACICLLTVVAMGEIKSGEEINWQVVSAGGVEGTSTDFILNGAAGQTATGTESSTSFIIFAGYWQKNYDDPCCDMPGDANNNMAVNILDVTFLIGYIYKGGPAPPCMPEGDANGDGKINILDVTRLIGYLYKLGMPPVCGPDPWP